MENGISNYLLLALIIFYIDFVRMEGNVLFNDALNTFYFYGYMASDIWLRTILIVIKETRCRHLGYSFRLTARVLLYAPSHRQDSTYHGPCYTSRGALAGTRNSSMGSPHEGSIRRPIVVYENVRTFSYHCFSTIKNCFILLKCDHKNNILYRSLDT